MVGRCRATRTVGSQPASPARSRRGGARRLDRVVGNRQSILDPLRLLRAPTQQARIVLGDMQDAFRESLAADRHYRDGFVAAGAGTRCPIPTSSSSQLAKRADVRATAAKQRFVSAFNSLATRVNRLTWSAAEF
jgi:hypothetical protein